MQQYKELLQNIVENGRNLRFGLSSRGISMKLLLLLILVGGCGTTSLLKCKKFVGPEKDECVRQTELKQRDTLGRMERIQDRNLGRRKY
jgi:hypothetical protein